MMSGGIDSLGIGSPSTTIVPAVACPSRKASYEHTSAVRGCSWITGSRLPAPYRFSEWRAVRRGVQDVPATTRSNHLEMVLVATRSRKWSAWVSSAGFPESGDVHSSGVANHADVHALGQAVVLQGPTAAGITSQSRPLMIALGRRGSSIHALSQVSTTIWAETQPLFLRQMQRIKDDAVDGYFALLVP